jgi:hypothetical protein
MEPASVVCDVLNKLFWKCPCPERLNGDINEWAAVWIGELRDIPGTSLFLNRVQWDAKNSLFYTPFKP